MHGFSPGAQDSWYTLKRSFLRGLPLIMGGWEVRIFAIGFFFYFHCSVLFFLLEMLWTIFEPSGPRPLDDRIGSKTIILEKDPKGLKTHFAYYWYALEEVSYWQGTPHDTLLIAGSERTPTPFCQWCHNVPLFYVDSCKCFQNSPFHVNFWKFFLGEAPQTPLHERWTASTTWPHPPPSVSGVTMCHFLCWLMQMLPEFTISREFLKFFLWEAPQTPPPPWEVNHLNTFYLDALHTLCLDVLWLVCTPLPLTSGSATLLNHSPCHNPPPPPQRASWIALSATLKDLSATSKSRENPGPSAYLLPLAFSNTSAFRNSR